MNENKRKESRLQNVLRKKTLSFEELKYIDPQDFLKWQGIGIGLFNYTENKLRDFGWTFGIYPFHYYVEHRQEIQGKVQSVAKHETGWASSRDALAKEILVAYCANHDMIAEEARINDIIRISIKTASRFIRELAQ